MAHNTSTSAALIAVAKGYQPIPILTGDKKPGVPAWTRLRWDPDKVAETTESFDTWAADGRGNLGLLLGEPSNNLVDVDIDHAKAMRMRDYFLPPTAMKSGREGRPSSHYWYIAEDGTLPGTRQHLMPGENGKRGGVSVELRSTLAQTVIPPSIHPSGEKYTWSGDPWGGEMGPAIVNGKKLAVQVALLGLSAVLLDHWPSKGTRHEAYLALAGGLLSYGDLGVHPFWERNASVLIRALAMATMDDDGPDAREKEVIHTTLAKLRAGGNVTGLGSLVDIIGEDHVKQARVLIAEVESAAGFVSRQASSVEIVNQATPPSTVTSDRGAEEARISEIAALPMEDRDPLGERSSTWQPVDLEPYLSGQFKVVEPSVLLRSDGQALMYPGRVNMLYGSSETAKSWIALQTCLQQMDLGERAVYVDFEDEPVNTLERLKALGAAPDDIRKRFTYIRPEDPIAAMQRNRWGREEATGPGQENQNQFDKALDAIDPTLIIADGMSVIYGLHGLNTNDTVETDVITSWLKRLTRNGRTTVIVIDHTSKGAEKGTTPIGSQHKVSMVQGTLLQAWPISQPMPGAIGEIELVVLKDRPGQVRAASQKSGGVGKVQVSAIVKMDSRQAGVTVMTIDPPQSPVQQAASGVIDLQRVKAAEDAQKKRDAEELVKYIYAGELGKELSLMEITTFMPPGWTGKQTENVVKRLVETGWLSAEGNTKSRKYKLQIGGSGYESDLTVDLSNVV